MGFPPTANLVLHYKLNDNAANTTITDSSANGYNGGWVQSEINCNTSVSSVPGKINTSLNYISALATYSKRALAPNLNFTTGNFSVSLWVKADATQNQWATLIDRSSNWTAGWYIGASFIAPNSTDIIIAAFTAAGGVNILSTTGVLEPGNWVYITIIRSGTVCNIYKNTVEVDYAYGGYHPAFVSPDSCSNAFNTGNCPWGNSYNGLLDDIRIYDIALTQANMDALYNGGRGTEDNSFISPFPGRQ
jgi:hypothetical protein